MWHMNNILVKSMLKLQDKTEFSTTVGSNYKIIIWLNVYQKYRLLKLFSLIQYFQMSIFHNMSLKWQPIRLLFMQNDLILIQFSISCFFSILPPTRSAIPSCFSSGQTLRAEERDPTNRPLAEVLSLGRRFP